MTALRLSVLTRGKAQTRVSVPSRLFGSGWWPERAWVKPMRRTRREAVETSGRAAWVWRMTMFRSRRGGRSVAAGRPWHSLASAFSYGVASMVMVFMNKAVLMQYVHSMTLLTLQISVDIAYQGLCIRSAARITAGASPSPGPDRKIRFTRPRCVGYRSTHASGNISSGVADAGFAGPDQKIREDLLLPGSGEAISHNLVKRSPIIYYCQAGKQSRPEKFEIPAKIKLTLPPWTSSLRGGHQEGIRDGPCPVVQPKKAEDYRNSLQQEAQAKAQALHFEDELARKRMPVTARDMHSRYIPQQDYFSEGLYTFDIGQNDLAGEFYSRTEDQVIVSIPTILLEFENGLKVSKFRNFILSILFLLYAVLVPLGCLPQNIALFGKDPSQLDELHCVAKHNRAAKLFNLQLHALCMKLRAEFDGASITYVDIHTIKYSLIANYSRYGFEHATQACRGYGGPPLNYDGNVPCGHTVSLDGKMVTAKGCSDTTEFVNWDGIHYTEAVNFRIASQILTGKYSDPPFVDKMSFVIKPRF
ncbi:GDSL esterase/lipase [Zea mays]|uniref:GDSL esterase/lipase n=1 Tax=Zea mays TaxID=4577 RepID=A0A317YKA8_MAIZE|nr:GDSL esterase/lipase [Zea mays]